MQYDVTSDTGFIIKGKEKKELLENAFYELMNFVSDTKKIKSKQIIDLNVFGKDFESTVFKYLNELIYLMDSEDMFFNKIELRKISDKEIRAVVFGEKIKKEKGKVQIKAITKHDFQVSSKELRFVVDI